jgi:hypothetical protein
MQIPDLIGVKDRRYLDRTGLELHRDISDFMRYSAMNQLMDSLDYRSVEGYPIKPFPWQNGLCHSSLSDNP